MARTTTDKAPRQFTVIDSQTFLALGAIYIALSVFGFCFLWFFASIGSCMILNGLLGAIQGYTDPDGRRDLLRLIKEARHSADPLQIVTGQDFHRFSWKGDPGKAVLLLLLALVYSIIPFPWVLAIVVVVTVILANLQETNRLIVLQSLRSTLLRMSGQEVSIHNRLTAYVLGLGMPLGFFPLFVAARLNGFVFHGMASLDHFENWTIGYGLFLTGPLFVTAVMSCWLRLSPPVQLSEENMRALILETDVASTPESDD